MAMKYLSTAHPLFSRMKSRQAASSNFALRTRRDSNASHTRVLLAVVAVFAMAVPGVLLSFSQAGAASAPTVTAIGPDNGPLIGGTTVTVTGTNFVAGQTTVHFGFSAATNVVVNSPTSLTAVSPAGPDRAVDVIVTVSGQSSPTNLSDLFAYGQPAVTALTPSGGPTSGGTSVIINGTGFVPGTTVSFGGTPASGVMVRSATTITALTPASSSGWTDATVTTPAGTSAVTSFDRFAYVVPSVEWVSPDTGPLAGGTPVTIVGSGFSAASTVAFGANAATSVVFKSPNVLTAVAPAGASGSTDVIVTTAPNGASAAGATDLFAYGAVPSVGGVSPRNGPVVGGTSVVITGSGFTADSVVRFGSSRATTATVVSGTEIIAVAPPEASGAVDVTVTSSAGASAPGAADLFAYGAPSVSSVSPSVGSIEGATMVAVIGTGFVPGATVTFGATASPAVSVTSATTLTAIAPRVRLDRSISRSAPRAARRRAVLATSLPTATSK